MVSINVPWLTITGPFSPGRENFFLFHLIDSFVGGHGPLDGGSGVLEHLEVGADIVEMGEGAVTVDHLYVGRQLGDGSFNTVSHAQDAAAAGDINEGKAVANEVVAHVYDVIFGEKDDGVAVRVAGGKV